MLFLSFYSIFSRDNFLILQALIGSMAFYMFPFLQNLPPWNTMGVIAALILHVVISEPLFYWLHRKFHEEHLFNHYHSLHHSSPVPESFTGQRNQIAETSLSFFPPFFFKIIFLNLKLN